MNGLDTIIKELRGARMDLRGCTEGLDRAEFMRQQSRRWAKQKRSRAEKCNCDAYAFPHRIGGGKCIAISGARS